MAVDHGDGEHLRVDCPAVAEHVGDVRRAVVAFAADARASEAQLLSVGLAVSEAATNVVLHAYNEHAAPGRLMVHAWVQDSTLHVHIIDDGIGMKPRIDSPGAGFGLDIIAAVTEYFEIESGQAAPGVRLRLVFALD